MSRNNKPIYNTEYIKEAILKAGIKNTVLDGEFYTSYARENEDWSRTTSILRTQSEHPDASDINFWAFDIVPLSAWSNQKYDLMLRNRKLSLLLTINKINHPSIIYTDHRLVIKPETIKDHMSMLIEAGFEGIVLKNPDSFYEWKRSSNWLKLKPVHTEEFPIIGVQEGKGKYIGTTGAILINVNGTIVGVGTGMTDLEREEIWKDRNLLEGVLLEVSYQTKSSDGSLIFPVFQRIRWDLT